MVVNSRDYTSNNAKLLKHLDVLKKVQGGTPAGPIMVHQSLTSNCNLNCSYCCYAGRTKGESLSLERVISSIDQFYKLGVRGFEFTGSGEPTLHPNVSEIIDYAHSLEGVSIGVITNGTNVGAIKHWDFVSWVRVSPHVLVQSNPFLEKRFLEGVSALKRVPGLDVGSVFILSDDYDAGLAKFIKFANQYELPSRITPDLTKPNDWIMKHMERVKDLMKNDPQYQSEWAFVSDFNLKLERENHNCYMRLVKPFVHTDGFVYDCPGAVFAPENFRNVDARYRVCSIDDIFKTYSNPDNLKLKTQDCSLCKYQTQNDLFNDLLRVTRHNDFA